MILAIDLGSTSFKAAVYTAGLHLRGSSGARLRYANPAGGVEMRVDDVAEACRACIGEALAGASARSLAAVAITSQAQTFTITDDARRPLLPFISWQDQRAAGVCARAAARAPWTEIREHASFGALIPGLMAGSLLRLRHEGLLPPSGHLLPLPSYLAWTLSGRVVIDENWAAMSGLYSLQNHGWWAEALAAIGYAPAQLPPLAPVGEPVARTGPSAVAFGVPAGTPILFAGNDQTAGAYGALLHRRRGTLLALGTALAAYSVHDALPPPSLPNVARGAYPGGRYYQLAASNLGGNILTWAVATLFGEGEYAAFFAAVDAAASGSEGVSFNPDLLGEGGGWQQVRLHHGRPELARAVAEALAANVVELIDQVRDPRREGPILVAGGGSANAGWVDFLRDAAGLPMRAVETDPLLGAARLAREWLGQPASARKNEVF